MAAVKVQGETITVSWTWREWSMLVSVLFAIGSGWASLRMEILSVHEAVKERKPAVESIPLLRATIDTHDKRIGKLETKVFGQ